MAIKIDVGLKEQGRAKKLGACLLPDGRTWVIPDEIKHINRFKRWLPNEEGFIVKRPYFVARARMPCYKCKEETPVIALGATLAQQASFSRGDSVTWSKWDSPVLFTEVEYVDEEVIKSLQAYYPFFKYVYLKAERRKIWGNTCVHCGALQEEDGEFRYEANALQPITMEALREVRIIYFDLEFDYYINACFSMDMLFAEMMMGGM